MAGLVRRFQVGWCVMRMRMDRPDDPRKVATECLALAHTASDERTRMSLLSMAQKLLELANAPAAQTFNAILPDFNDQQMGKH
jgi:hypothetical protein